MLKLFAVILFTYKTMYNKTIIIIRFSFCDIWNNQGRGNCYQPKPHPIIFIIRYIHPQGTRLCYQMVGVLFFNFMKLLSIMV